jgi:hypothetical protein
MDISVDADVVKAAENKAKDEGDQREEGGEPGEVHKGFLPVLTTGRAPANIVAVFSTPLV